MAKFRRIAVFAIALIIGGGLLPSVSAAPSQVSWISKDGLKSLLGRPDVIVIDVRLPGQWKGSEFKIAGALREDPGQSTESWAAKYPKDKTIILYCG
jgi:rhodanese-related sulfurtransferase